ncbi:MAG: hypothetical protein C0481_01775 [Phenylobacterium sp.]|uniref:Gfo/Idh/MocA family protein n=1 Tax=Phenylobacterium sp. TaxID=1871053 RepID=UPI0025D0B849|nr:Gfo/Idh/MocA family oxidoreductase [Phenylobacterium sp.]MBA4010572.1 hypothetical protein [Phenylobacterium sp.]
MIRIGLSGCGAVSARYYAPALIALEAAGEARLVAVFDPDVAARQAICDRLPGARPCASYEELLDAGLDLVLVASPPRRHAEQVLAALARGLAVHCEKPLAMSGEEAATMIAAAQTAGRPLTEGLMRRQFPSVRAIADLLRRRAIGELMSVEVFEGGPFDWPVSSPGYFSRAESGGGVLRDLGPHVFDLLIGWLGEPQLVAYADDRRGGVEANARVELDFAGVPAKIRLSRDWARPNRFVFHGASGNIAWTPYETDRLELSLDGQSAALVLDGAGEFQDAFTAQLRAAIAGPGGAGRGAEPGLAALRLIDVCYGRRQPMAEPWIDAGVRP